MDSMISDPEKNSVKGDQESACWPGAMHEGVGVRRGRAGCCKERQRSVTWEMMGELGHGG